MRSTGNSPGYWRFIARFVTGYLLVLSALLLALLLLDVINPNLRIYGRLKAVARATLQLPPATPP